MPKAFALVTWMNVEVLYEPGAEGDEPSNFPTHFGHPERVLGHEPVTKKDQIFRRRVHFGHERQRGSHGVSIEARYRSHIRTPGNAKSHSPAVSGRPSIRFRF